MNCEELLNYLSDYIDNDLDEALSAAATAHLATCHNCRVVVDTTTGTIELYREQGRRVIPALRRRRLLTLLTEAFSGTSESDL